MNETETWPPLPLEEWQDTFTTLHLWTQIVGKTRLALAPAVNHWWHVALYVTARGLTTSPIPYGLRTFEVELDFIDHRLIVRTSEGATRSLPLVPRTVADFYREYRTLLGTLGIAPKIRPVAVELPEAIRLAEDDKHASYDADAAHRCWRILLQTDRVLKEYRSRFLGKSSPVHFFWGAFDLACTRFSGRPAPRHPGGIPNTPDYVAIEGYSHECASVGWWPGGEPLKGPAFYAYSYPEPEGYAAARIQPADAYYDTTLREFILPYDAVRTASDPDALLMDFFQSTYEAGANLAAWDRVALER